MKKLSVLILLLAAINLIIVNQTKSAPLPPAPKDTTVYFSIPDTTVAIGDTILLPVYGNNFNDVGSIGLYIEFDTTKVKYLGVINAYVTGGMYSMDQGTFMYGWTSASFPLTFSNEILFYLKLYYYNSGKADITFIDDFCSSYKLSPLGLCNDSLTSGSISGCTPSASVISHSSPLTFCSGDSCVLNANIIQNAKYQWRFNGSDINGATNTSYSAETSGTYQLIITNSQKCSSLSTGVTTSVLTVPGINSVTPGFVCGSGTVTLKAIASSGTINWYNVPTGGSTLYSGNSFTTPSLTSTTNYYTDATDNGCTTNSRTLVTASVNTIPTITSTTPGSHCGPGIVTLGASASAGTINWYSAATGGSAIGNGTSFNTPSISCTTTYYTDATLNGCTSQSRTSVVATLKTIPIISGTTGASICGPDSLVLKATVSTGTINWYNSSTGGNSVHAGTSYTTPLINSTTNYYVDATLNGCTSPTRTSVTATIKPIPQITSTQPGFHCGKGTVTLSAVSNDGGTVNWYSIPSGGARILGGNSYTTPTITTTTTYYVDATANGCKTLTTTPIIASIYSVPVVSNVTPASVCGKNSVVLGATASKGIARWYNTASDNNILDSGATFTTPVISTTQSYYVDANNNGCVSASRTKVTATINQLPKVTITPEGSTTICTGGYVIININEPSDTLSFQWYENGNNLTSAKGSVLLVSTEGNYTVKTTDNNNCTAYSDTISVIVNPLPVVNMGGNKSISTNDSIVLDAGSGFKSYLWSNNSTSEKITLKGSKLGAGNFTYSVTVTNNNNCEGSSSMNLQVTQNNYTISGYFTYDNSKSTPLENVKVVLLNINGEKKDSVNTDAEGHYTFNNVSNGNYKFNAGINLSWGGVDPIDALLTNRSYLHMYSFSDKLEQTASDVNEDGKVNPIDALLVNRRYIHLVNSFKAGDWTFITDTVNVNGANVTNNLKAVCTGDVNGTYVPSGNKIMYKEISQNSEIVNPTKGEAFDLPVYLNTEAGISNTELGAMGIKLKVQSSMFKVLNVKSDLEGLIYNITDDEVDIAWTASDKGYNISADKPLFVLSAQCSVPGNSLNSNIQLTSESVISDFDANTINTDMLAIPKIEYNSQSTELSFSNYPNPFNSQTTIVYSIQEDANVNISIYNVLGEKVANLVNELQSTGRYTIKFDRSGLREGIYYCKMITDNGKSDKTKTDIMVITK